MRRPLALLSLGALTLSLAACAEDDSQATAPTEATASVSATTTTTEPPTFCGIAKVYATEVVDALENESNQTAEDSPMNTRAFWERYKELQTQMRDLAPPEIRAEANIAYESAMAAYDYMEVLKNLMNETAHVHRPRGWFGNLVDSRKFEFLRTIAVDPD